MWRLWLSCLLFAVVSLAGSASAPAREASRSATTACTVQLRVDIFGSPVSWAKAAGLTTGHAATLRAVARGCTLDHITGRYVGRPAAAPRQHACAGAICLWHVQSAGMQALDFQAFARTSSGARVRSNIVRVAWAGEDSVVGNWAWSYAAPGTALAPHGTVTFEKATMTWSQGGGGSWERSGQAVTLTWDKGSVDRLTLSADGRTLTGTNEAGWQVIGTKQ